METTTTHDYLVRLRDLIFEERACAKALDMKGMIIAMNRKEELVKVLNHVKVIDEQDKPIARQIREENRRNAFLFKSTLGWIRQTMEFFGQKTVTTTYSASAYTVASRVNGRLLSGKV
ncbi:flagellar protein FlgN [Desulfopila sp. IMCC35006]|uniref:flagellar protein FlgN n=1 Tax=Desulfopila sp. IMCC35006 TaxID=2569542 RepID=UPI0010AD6306|nr:flagellar protein FlgN [Desulfopila sp. IMCC35006]TKB25823.1 flagellar protein FlgN [Desulfopila sp. IMCC35006]